MEYDSISWEQIYADIDTILNGDKPEYQDENVQKSRIVRLHWDPDETVDKDEFYLAPGEIPGQPILKANGKDRRRLFR
jgi:hypothetical protein